MTESDRSRAIVTSNAGLRSLRDRLEGTAGLTLGRPASRASRTTLLVLDASASMTGSESEVRRGACAAGAGGPGG